MIHISCRGRYASRAMVELASNTSGTPIPLSLIAEHQDLSRTYLQQLMGHLKRANLVKVVQGFKGGFFLARPADEITLGDILKAVEGDLALVNCVNKKNECDFDGNCYMQGVWTEASRRLSEYFDSISLADVLRDMKQQDLL